MKAAAANRQAKKARKAARSHEETLARQYELSIRAAARRVTNAYRKQTTVVTAAAPPPISQILDGKVLTESTLARTAAARKRMARAAIEAAVISEPLRADSLERVSVLTAAQAGRQAERLFAGVEEAVSHVILESMTSQWSVPETAREISTVVGGNAKWQAQMLARTDLVSISNAASLEGAMSLGEDAPPTKVWLATSDNRTRESHAAADGQEVAIDDPFSVGGSDLMYPGDPDGPDEQCVNCRCSLIYSDGIAGANDAVMAAALRDWDIDEEDEMETLVAAEFSTKERQRLADEGVAMDDGSFPIRNMSDLRNAVSAYGRARDPEAAKAHIIKRARALDAVDELPEDWNITAAAVSGKAAEISRAYQGHPDAGKSIVVRTEIEIPEHDGKAEYRDLRHDAQQRHGDVEFKSEGRVASASEDCGCGGACKETVTAAVAVPDAAPADWFQDPGLEAPTPLTVTEDGRVFGHIAQWGQCHTGFPDKCVTPPQGLSYDFFNVGAIDTSEGETIRVGKITVGTGHAPITASRASAAAHYDNTGSVVAYVRGGEDQFGPWVAGVVKPDATPEQIRDMRANGPSGDWRMVRTPQRQGLELVGVLAVPVQGFPIAAMAASGGHGEEVVALVAGSAYESVDGQVDGFDEQIAALHKQVIGVPDISRVRVIYAAVAQTDEFVANTPAGLDMTVDREVAFLLNDFKDNGTWSLIPLSGEDLTEEQWALAREMAAFMTNNPSDPEVSRMKRRLLAEGLLV